MDDGEGRGEGRRRGGLQRTTVMSQTERSRGGLDREGARVLGISTPRRRGGQGGAGAWGGRSRGCALVVARPSWEGAGDAPPGGRTAAQSGEPDLAPALPPWTRAAAAKLVRGSTAR